MLILTRRIGEAIIIGDGDHKATVTILNNKGNQVQLGINAPKTMPVHREEVYERIRENGAISKKAVHS